MRVFLGAPSIPECLTRFWNLERPGTGTPVPPSPYGVALFLH